MFVITFIQTEPNFDNCCLRRCSLLFIVFQIKRELLMDLADGTRIVTTRAFCTMGERRLTDRHMSGLCSFVFAEFR